MKSLEQQNQKEKDLATDYGLQNQKLHSLLSTSSENINACLQERYCNGIIGVPVTFIGQYNPSQFSIIGHDHDINGDGGKGIYEGQFEAGGKGKYKRILIRKILQR